VANEITFTPEEISVIDKHLRPIVFDWPKHLVNRIILSAKKEGVSRLFINSRKTLDSGVNDDKAEYFYETLPENLGFHKTQANLRGKGLETLWVMEINKPVESKILSDFIKLAQSVQSVQSVQEKLFAIDQIPKKYQGAVLSILGRKPKYTKNELLKVINILENKEKNKKEDPQAFFYDSSTPWEGGQRFDNAIKEVVFKQKIHDQTQALMETDPVLSKFWGFLLNKQTHFGADVVGFALVSIINKDNWVINQIQTDSIQHYLNIRAKYYKKNTDKKDKKLSWDTIKDMLQAQNKSNWISKIETNESLKNQIIDNPNIIQQLPDNSVNIDEWLEKNRRDLENAQNPANRELMQAFQSVNFNSRVFRLG